MFASLALFLVYGCQSPGKLGASGCDVVHSRDSMTVAEKKLHYGVLSYEEGNYPASITALQGVLDAVSARTPEKVTAYKYLAFIHCVSGKEALCRDNFRKAHEIDQGFNLDSAEAGHPIWGPVFRSVKNKNVK